MDTSIDPQRRASVTAAELANRLEIISQQLQHEVGRLTATQVSNAADAQLLLLREELGGMGRLIAETRAEIAGLGPTGVAHSHLISASDELDGVVVATERAAVEIMVAAERSQEASQRMRTMPNLTPEITRELDVIEAAAMDVFMACSFQDLTGQRIRKVVQALSYIEKRVITLTDLWVGSVAADPSDVAVFDTRQDAHLLNGPDANGLQQNDIDSLLHDSPAAAHVSQNDIDSLFD
jgi:chemotaxis regulatin CheY-phosphate phosphatase CheZ